MSGLLAQGFQLETLSEPSQQIWGWSSSWRIGLFILFVYLKYVFVFYKFLWVHTGEKSRVKQEQLRNHVMSRSSRRL